jgi:hypothetical protein
MSEAEGFLWSRLPASLAWPARPDLCRLPSLDRHGLCPGHRSAAVPPARRGPSCRPTGVSDLLHPGKQPFRSCHRRQTPLTSRTAKWPVSRTPSRPSHVRRLPHVRPGRRKPVSQTPGPAYVPRLPDIQPAHVRRLPAAQPGRRPSSPGRPARPTSRLPTAPIWAARGASPSAAVGRFVAAYRWCFAFVAV